MRIVRTLHRRCAVVVTVFVLAHLANHAAALGGIAAHARFMEGARLVYRQPVVEAVLLLCVALQAASGLWLAGAGWKRRSGWIAWLQAASGAYLALAAGVPLAAGVLFSGLVVAALMGKLYPYEIPQAYRNTYTAQ